MNKNHIELFLSAIFLMAFCLLSILTIGDYQGWGGDFAHYLTISRNILWDRPLFFSLSGYPAYLPVYPALLAALIKLFGFGYSGFGFTNAVLWITACFMGLWTFTDPKQTPVERFVLYCCFGLSLFSPVVFWMLQDVLPNIFHAAIIITAIFFFTKEQESQPLERARLNLALGFGFALLAGLSRTTSLSLYAALVAYFILQRRILPTVISGLIAIACISIEQYFAYQGKMRSNFDEFFRHFDHSVSNAGSNAGEQSAEVIALLQNFLHLFSSFLSSATHNLMPHSRIPLIQPLSFYYQTELGQRCFHIIAPVFILLLVYGVWVRVRSNRVLLPELFLLSHLTLISAFAEKNVAMRYAIPVYIIFNFLCFTGLAHLSRKGAKISVLLSASLIALCFYTVIADDIDAIDIPRTHNRANEAGTLEFVAWYNTNMPNAEIAFFNPRTISYLVDTAQRDTPPKVTPVRSWSSAKKFFNSRSPLHKALLLDTRMQRAQRIGEKLSEEYGESFTVKRFGDLALYWK